MDKLPALIYARINRRILSLEDNPRPRGTKKLSGREEHRLRVGDYRGLYNIDDENGIITVFAEDTGAKYIADLALTDITINQISKEVRIFSLLGEQVCFFEPDRLPELRYNIINQQEG